MTFLQISNATTTVLYKVYMKKGRLIVQQKDEIVTDLLCKNWLIFWHFYLVKTGSKIIADLQSDNKLNVFADLQ